MNTKIMNQKINKLKNHKHKMKKIKNKNRKNCNNKKIRWFWVLPIIPLFSPLEALIAAKIAPTKNKIK